MSITRTALVGGLLAVAFCVGAPTVHARALVGTAGDGNLGLFLPTPAVGLPNPAIQQIAGFPAGAQPHGTAIIGTNQGLVADFANSRVFLVSLQPAQVTATLPTPGYNGSGTLAVSPDRSVALASGFVAQLTVIRAPFSATSALSQIQLPAPIASFATQNIDFDAQGRAYVRHTAGISVIDPPYQAVAFTLPLNSLRGGGIAVSPDGSRLITGYVVSAPVDLPARAENAPSPAPGPVLGDLPAGVAGGTAEAGLDVFTLPLGAASTAQRVALLDCACYFAAVQITPDGQRAVLGVLSDVPDSVPVVHSLPAPFTDPSALQALPLPPGFVGAQGFEDIGISADGSEAILTGQSLTGGSFGGLPALHLRAPFTTAGVQASALVVPGGRGAGSVRYAPAGTLPPPPPPVAAQPVPTLTPWQLLLLAAALAWLGGGRLRRRSAA